MYQLSENDADTTLHMKAKARGQQTFTLVEQDKRRFEDLLRLLNAGTVAIDKSLHFKGKLVQLQKQMMRECAERLRAEEIHPDAQARLIQLADSWIEVGADAARWMRHYPHNLGILQRALEVHRPTIEFYSGRFFRSFSAGHRLSMAEESWRKAARLFSEFLCDAPGDLRRCQDQTCRRFFRKTAKRTHYCSDPCANRSSGRRPKKNAYHRIAEHGRYECLIELAGEAEETPIRSRGAWLQHILEWSKNRAQSTIAKKARLKRAGKRLAPVEHKYLKKLTATWLRKRVFEQPGREIECETCRNYDAQIRKIVDQLKGVTS